MSRKRERHIIIIIVNKSFFIVSYHKYDNEIFVGCLASSIVIVLINGV